MDLGINGKVAIVTGGSHGIGLAISEELARNGANVIVVARGQEQLDDAVKAIKVQGGQAASISADLTDINCYSGIVEKAIEIFGVPEIAVFSPVGPPPGAFDEFSDADFEESFHNVVTNFANFVRAVVPGMKEQRWGRIITVASGCGKSPVRRSTFHFDYVLANTVRPAAVGLARTLADELGSYGITVNGVPPGFIYTGEGYKDWFQQCADKLGQTFDEFMDNELKVIPMNRMGRPEEVASLCAYLCSQNAGYITGQYILVDGGRIESYT